LAIVGEAAGALTNDETPGRTRKLSQGFPEAQLDRRLDGAGACLDTVDLTPAALL
jgi:hypothetical protein